MSEKKYLTTYRNDGVEVFEVFLEREDVLFVKPVNPGKHQLGFVYEYLKESEYYKWHDTWEDASNHLKEEHRFEISCLGKRIDAIKEQMA